MLDAGAAVAAASDAPLALIGSSPAAPVAGAEITFSSADSLASAGATLTGYAWTLVDGGGIATGFTSAANAANATLTPGAAGTLRVRLTVTDSLGRSASGALSVTVASAPPPPAGGGSGGGAMSGAWLALLSLAVAVLAAPQRRH